MPKNNSETYEREIWKTIINAKKLLDGVEAHFVTRTFMERFKESVDFPLSFPMKKV
jgi:hypothetical protein